jgi:hypothetical protein
LPGAASLQSGDVGGMITGNERFLRENRQAGQFVGGTTAGVGALRGQDPTTAPGSTGMFGTTSRFSPFNAFGPYGMMNPMTAMYQQGMYNQLSRQRRPLRMPVQLGFAPAAITAATKTPVAQRVQTRLAHLPQLRANPGAVKVEMEGRIAVLTGQVASEHDRNLIGRLLLLEPGIADVRNELTVAPPAESKPAP